MKRKQHTQKRCAEGRAALGTGLKEFASRGVPHIIQHSGFDYCMIDMEHGAFDLENHRRSRRLVRGHGSGRRSCASTKRFVHHIPLMASTRASWASRFRAWRMRRRAREIVREAKYPPIGHRGMSGMGAAYGLQKLRRSLPKPNMRPWANANVILCPSIEFARRIEKTSSR